MLPCLTLVAVRTRVLSGSANPVRPPRRPYPVRPRLPLTRRVTWSLAYPPLHLLRRTTLHLTPPCPPLPLEPLLRRLRQSTASIVAALNEILRNDRFSNGDVTLASAYGKIMNLCRSIMDAPEAVPQG